MQDCIFCKIIKGVLPSNKVYEDENIYAFHDIAPNAPFHILVIPKEHIGSADSIDEKNSWLISKIFEAIPKIAKNVGIKNGYRIISNCGADAFQTVPHLHFHILGGKSMDGPLV